MDSNSFIYPILTDPVSGDALVLDKDENQLVAQKHNRNYKIINNIPEIFNPECQYSGSTPVHSKYKTSFEYRSHYINDAEYFDYSEDRESLSNRHEFNRLRQYIRYVIGRKYNMILDIGCGKAWAARMFIPMGKKVISMDISRKNPLNAVKQYPHTNHAALIADVYNIPLKNDSVDCIIASQMLEHLSDPSEAMLKMTEKLVPGGKLIITVPNNEKIEYSLCVHCNKPTPHNAHIHSFNKLNIHEYLPESGIQYKIRTFSNKYLQKLRADILFGFLPFSIWRVADKIFNTIWGKPSRLMLEIIKK